MRDRTRVLAGVAAFAVTCTAIVGESRAQDAAGPEARYVMDVGTVAGMMGQGDRHELVLRLGSRLAATGAPRADHFMPQAARLGPSVPLVTPKRANDPSMPANWERPRGRMLLYWGCGERVGPGQPVVIDFAKVAAGQMPAGLVSARAPVEIGPQLGNSRSFGEWPNGSDGRNLSAQSSVLGQHRIAGTYSPEIAFALDQDFMGTLRVRSAPAAGGASTLSWSPLTNATGYYAWAMGSKDMGRGGKDGDMIWWSSSMTQDFGGGLADWLSPGTVGKLIGQKVVMPASQTSCTMPAEVRAAAGEMMMTFLTAYGPERNFAFPERPRDPKVAWRPKWTAKVRYRSMAHHMLGMPDMQGMMSQAYAEDEGEEEEAPRRPAKPCKPSLGGMLGGALGARRSC